MSRSGISCFYDNTFPVLRLLFLQDPTLMLQRESIPPGREIASTWGRFLFDQR